MSTTALLSIIGELHPILLHYAIAFLTIAAFCDLIHGRWGLTLDRCAHWFYILGALTCIPTVASGLAAGSFMDGDDPYLIYHRLLGIGTLAIATLLATFRAGILKEWWNGRHFGLLVASVGVLTMLVLVGETGGVLTHGKTPFLSRVQPTLVVAEGASPPIPSSIGDAFSAVEPFLETHITFEHVDKIFRDRQCIDCHGEMGQAHYPKNLHEMEANSIEWLPACDDLSPESIGLCELYQAMILDNRMPPALDDENPAGLPLGERLLIFQFLKNLSSSGPLSERQESQGSDEQL